MNWKTGMHPVSELRGGGGYMYRLSVPLCREGGVVYDLKIESKINLAGKAILKIYVINY